MRKQNVSLKTISSSAARAEAISKALCAKPPFEFSAGLANSTQENRALERKRHSGKPD
jgi:hypothetical protein